MNEQLAIQHLLQRKLFEARAKNPSFSLRAFAKKLKIGAGPLSQILAGNRRVSLKMAARLCDALFLDPSEKTRVLTHFTSRIKSASKPGAINQDDLLRLTADQYKVIADWYNYAILSLITTKNFSADPQWIADRLGITKTEATQSLERMLRLEMIAVDANGKWSRTKAKYETCDEVANISARMANLKSLDLAKASLERDAPHLRDFTSITVPTHTRLLPKAKKLIRKFQHQMMALMMSEPESTEVYRMSIELFPLSKLSNSNEVKPNAEISSTESELERNGESS